MSLAQRVAHFNQHFQRIAQHTGRAPLALEEGVVVAGFHGMRLESTFDAVLDSTGAVLGYQAQFHAFSPRGTRVSPRAPYAVALDADSIVDLDRLMRTLHVLNATAQDLGGLLFLDVHPWHIAQVSGDHGAVFEDILRECGRLPGTVVLQITDAVVQEVDHLARAIASFQARGFGIALHQRGTDAGELVQLLRLHPDIITLGRPHLAAAEASAERLRELLERVQQIREQGVRVLLYGVATEHQARIARWVGADGYQDSVRPSGEAATVIIVPGLGDSGPEHWQTQWGRNHPAYRRVRQRDWHQPQVDEWVAALDAQIRRAPSPVILVGHSLGCITIAEWSLRHWSDVRGALLVAPADTDQQPFFDRVPLQPLPFPSILVASENDPYLELERARLFARHWGSRLVNLGKAGHINVESGFGPWPDGENLLAELRASAWHSPAGAASRTAHHALPVVEHHVI
jgi:predicted alpha/beta hydrolase family esterase/EAL domain-containing protein (putative c-di-GMP-specific phosphodiesterase class I)